jgi:ABC-type glycerol-3-phosphate transport system substrate-binding protein
MRSKLRNSFPAMPRRTAMGLVAGGAMGLVLAACGGGGGDGSTGSADALRIAFAKLQNGMNAADVEALVGFNANNLRTEMELIWVVDGVRLYVGFYSTGSMTITSASLKDGSSAAQSRDFD